MLCKILYRYKTFYCEAYTFYHINYLFINDIERYNNYFVVTGMCDYFNVIHNFGYFNMVQGTEYICDYIFRIYIVNIII